MKKVSLLALVMLPLLLLAQPKNKKGEKSNTPVKSPIVNSFQDTAVTRTDTVKVMWQKRVDDGSYIGYEDGYLVVQTVKYNRLTQPIQGSQFLYRKNWVAVKLEEEGIVPDTVKQFNWK